MSTVEHTEEWRPVVGFENAYLISRTGKLMRTLSAGCTRAGRIVNGTIIRGYMKYTLHAGGSRKVRFAHALVMAAFVGPRPTRGMHINHLNGVKTDNRLENLEYCTALENATHARHILGVNVKGKYHVGEENSASNLTVMQVLAMRYDYEHGMTTRQIADAYGIKRPTVYAVVKRINWRHLP